MLEVLEIGGGTKPQAHLVWKDAHITIMDADANLPSVDIVNDARTMPDDLTGKFDVVFASHVLEHIPYWETIKTLKEWGKALKDGGELHVIVPSLEWAAREVLSEKPSRAVMPHLHAGLTTPWDVHLASFTMRHLRAVFEEANFSVIRARSGEYPIKVMEETLPAEQHYICGVKK